MLQDKAERTRILVTIIIAILEGPGQTRQYKLHKALVEVALSDVAALVKN